jgi:hypothetical protein
MGNLPELAMVTNLAASRTQEHTALQRMLGRGRFLSLLVLLRRAGHVPRVFLDHARRDGPSAFPQRSKTQPIRELQPDHIVDLHPWQIAQALAPLAVSKEEVEFAHEAERLADHEVNQAFAASLRQAGAQHLAPTGEALELSQKVAQLQQMAKEDQARVRSLTPRKRRKCWCGRRRPENRPGAAGP